MERNAAEATGDSGKGSVSWESQTQQEPARHVQDGLNLQAMNEDVVSLHKTISRIVANLNFLVGANAEPKWQDLMGLVSMVNLEFYKVIEELRKVSHAFVVYPRNVTSPSASTLPEVLSSNVLIEMEKEENSLRERMSKGMDDLSVSARIEAIKTRIDRIAEACEIAEKVIAEGRKDLFRTKINNSIFPTIDLVKAALLRVEEEKLRNAANHGEGLRRKPGDDMPDPSSFPPHIAEALYVNEFQAAAIARSNGVNPDTYLLSSTNNDSPGTSLKVRKTRYNYRRGPAKH